VEKNQNLLPSHLPLPHTTSCTTSPDHHHTPTHTQTHTHTIDTPPSYPPINRTCLSSTMSWWTWWRAALRPTGSAWLRAPPWTPSSCAGARRRSRGCSHPRSRCGGCGGLLGAGGRWIWVWVWLGLLDEAWGGDSWAPDVLHNSSRPNSPHTFQPDLHQSGRTVATTTSLHPPPQRPSPTMCIQAPTTRSQQHTHTHAQHTTLPPNRRRRL